jgi:hypothetical protein
VAATAAAAAQVTAAAGGFVVRLHWLLRTENRERELFQVLRLDGDRIRTMRDYRTAKEAAKAAA